MSNEAGPDTWIVVEKILEPGERLPDDWPVAGTTGYDFLNRVTGILIDPEGERPLTDFFARFTGISADYPAMVRDKKHLVLKELQGAHQPWHAARGETKAAQPADSDRLRA